MTLLLHGLEISALDVPIRNIEDDSTLRASLKDEWFLESPSRVLGRKKVSSVLPGGGKIEVRTEVGKTEFGVVLARERNGAYPGWAQGSWVLTRRKDTGQSLRIRVFIRSDPNVYVQFRPLNADKSLLDLVVYDAYIMRSTPLPFSFDRLMVVPIEEVLSSMGDKFPHKYFEPEPAYYRDSVDFVTSIRRYLPQLAFRDDGAMDQNGDYVFIETLEKQRGEKGLNCSGFAKWVIDGLLKPVTGQRLDIDVLKKKFGNRGTSFSAVYDEPRDLYFGLDWIRNLASIANRILLSENFSRQDEFEVKHWTFQFVTERVNNTRNTESYPGFLSDAGFAFEGLHTLMYTLAVTEPGRIYLAAVNREMGNPTLRQYFHVAVLVPYFNSAGNFTVTVFESAAETSFTAFKTRYPKGYFVSLVRIPLNGKFDP
ncbi:MAG: hypothetical protein LBG05_00510 [Treponema sp.]|jgi:hypothetical protein|nr:hypothetical protein [Treponema sp.]